MKLSDILKLEKRLENLNIIKAYLEQSLTEVDYNQAFYYYIDIAFECELYDLVLNQGDIFYEKFKNKDHKNNNQKVLKMLFNSAIKQEKFDLAKKYMEERSQILPILKGYLSIEDQIQYKKALNEPYYDELIRLEKESPQNDLRLFALEELYTHEVLKKDYEKALSYLDKIEDIQQSKEVIHKRIDIYIKLKRYDDVINYGEAYLKSQKTDAVIIVSLIEAYILMGNTHKPVLLESEYEQIIDEASDEIRIRAYDLIIDFYKKLNNSLSVKTYEKKKKSIKPSKNIDPVIEEKQIDSYTKPIVQIEIPSQKVIEKKSNLLKHFEWTLDILMFSHMIDEKLVLRDYLRTLFMHVDQFVNVKEYVFYFENDLSNLFHYKKERLYDKHILSSLLNDTLVEFVINNADSYFSSQKEVTKKNVLTQMDYFDDIKFIYAFPILNKGAFIVHLEEEIVDPQTYYDLFNGISKILEAKMLDDEKQERLRSKNNFYQKILNSPILAYRDMTDISSKYSEEAMRLLDVGSHEHFEIFLKDMAYDKVHSYRALIQKLFNHDGSYDVFSYQYQNKFIQEHLYAMKFEDTIHIISIFIDQTEMLDEKKTLYLKATNDLETGLANKNALLEEMPNYLNDKATFILFELNQDIKTIYGLDKMLLFFKEFSQLVKKHFNDGVTYRFDFYQLLVFLPYNDIRNITKLLKDFYRFIDEYKSVTLKYEKFKSNSAVLRYPVVTTEKNIDKLFKYLELSLEHAKRNNDAPFNFFVYQDYENEVFEQAVIDQLNVSLENKTMSLMFNQITDIQKNRIWQYESTLTISNMNIDYKYLEVIAAKRNRLIDLERYHIKAVCEFLNKLEEKTGKLIKITINISKETFIENTFNNYLFNTLKEYRIPAEFIRIVTDAHFKTQSYALQVTELLNYGVSIDTKSIDMAMNYPFNAVHLDLKVYNQKWLEYIKMLKQTLDSLQIALIIRSVKNKETREQLEKIGITYIEGTLYKQFSETELIKKIEGAI